MPSSSDYTKTLRDLHGEGKFEALDALGFGHEFLRDLMDESSAFSTMARMLKPITDNVPWIQEIYKIHESNQQYFNYLKSLANGVHLFIKEGWYLSLEFIDTLATLSLDEYFKENPSGFEEDVLTAFDAQMTAIEQKLITANQKRKDLLADIFKLHKAGIYNASILMALQQADGISKDKFSKKDENGNEIRAGFFDMNHEKPRGQKLSDMFNVPNNDWLNVIYNQLAKKDRNNSLVLEGNTSRLSDLNRHAIMHGESIDYGTKVNSVKSILLLDFIEDLTLMETILKDRASRQP